MRKPSLEEKWSEQAKAYKLEAAKVPPGRGRDHLLRMARQLEAASHMNDWLKSAELQPPK
jgi:hypothetical protein